MSRRATATSAGVTWHFAHAGPTIYARGAGGGVVGEFDPRGGRMRWNGRPLELRPAGSRKDHYALVAGEVDAALFEGGPWGRRPVEVDVLRPEAIDPGLILFTAFAVRQVADGASLRSGPC